MAVLFPRVSCPNRLQSEGKGTLYTPFVLGRPYNFHQKLLFSDILFRCFTKPMVFDFEPRMVLFPDQVARIEFDDIIPPNSSETTEAHHAHHVANHFQADRF